MKVTRRTLKKFRKKIETYGIQFYYNRVEEAMVTNSCNCAHMYLLTKDHKVVKEGNIPQSRPVIE